MVIRGEEAAGKGRTRASAGEACWGGTVVLLPSWLGVEWGPLPTQIRRGLPSDSEVGEPAPSFIDDID
eukprot:scaffold257032_cov18-Tisochrysis_lutea.AAC.1